MHLDFLGNMQVELQFHGSADVNEKDAIFNYQRKYLPIQQLVPGGSPDSECAVVCKIAFVSVVKLADLKKNVDEQESLVFATLASDLVVRGLILLSVVMTFFNFFLLVLVFEIESLFALLTSS
ncbi:uncharacterized protein LOC114296271 [Camellia sinensis]|uniref:uncharacterized protein LOC114296271 n=1 Tax=Camellia sinensis TaxID=4442 RepID=UPI001036B28D|nr:uncharacterized protein LOC114296271 [Camellia sinensis]XP_028096365.1 uncharacterized protein LOC114296271 [Camellia sinensis]